MLSIQRVGNLALRASQTRVARFSGSGRQDANPEMIINLEVAQLERPNPEFQRRAYTRLFNGYTDFDPPMAALFNRIEKETAMPISRHDMYAFFKQGLIAIDQNPPRVPTFKAGRVVPEIMVSPIIGLAAFLVQGGLGTGHPDNGDRFFAVDLKGLEERCPTLYGAIARKDQELMRKYIARFKQGSIFLGACLQEIANRTKDYTVDMQNKARHVK